MCSFLSEMSGAIQKKKEEGKKNMHHEEARTDFQGYG